MITNSNIQVLTEMHKYNTIRMIIFQYWENLEYYQLHSKQSKYWLEVQKSQMYTILMMACRYSPDLTEILVKNKYNPIKMRLLQNSNTDTINPHTGLSQW